jgi:threonine dehydratase
MALPLIGIWFGLNSCIIHTAPPLTASFKAGKPVEVEYVPSFISGIGIPIVLPEMWDLANRLLDGSMVSSLKEICDAVRMMAERNNVISEGASAVSVAAALAGKAGTGNVVCVVSGGNVDLHKLVKIFQGKIP